ncbi:3-hydroxyacyl-ACP dehydratase [Polaromonas hydrogenivorans]|uniref:3-hydroxyacyl-ACP dehydratase n=1 Tax=Polaromonas hydrogenivorans TaxID=335476 RepID=A0AAU7LMR0_9BURK
MSGETTLFIAPDHPAFAGHFPGMPILPGVVLLDAAVHAVSQALGASASSPAICQISSAKFLSPVGPGETLSLSWTSSASGSVRFDIACGSRKIATGTLVVPLAP